MSKSESEFEFTTYEAPATRPQFLVRFFHDAKGYGFLIVPGSSDAIVHYSEITGMCGHRTLWEADTVEADLVQGKRGLEARNVRLVLKGPRLKREPLVVSK